MRSNHPLNILVTRPENKSQALVSLLNQHGYQAFSQPLFDYQPYADSNAVKQALSSADILIFVSVAAVEFAHRQYPLTQTNQQIIFAVGKATQTALCQLGLSNVITPTIENSEGLLALPNLQKVNNKNIYIFRGDGGREHLAEQLTARGATVNYIESYQRVWRTLTKNITLQWYSQQINCIVVTSNAILNKLIKLFISESNTQENQSLKAYWLTDCLWLVASQRIADNAKAKGLSNVINMQGASEQVICQQLQQL